MKCKDCFKEIVGKPIKFQISKGHLTLEEVVCTDCAEKYNIMHLYKGDLEFCDNCGTKVDRESMKEFKKKKEVLKVCRQCFDQLCGFDPSKG